MIDASVVKQAIQECIPPPLHSPAPGIGTMIDKTRPVLVADDDEYFRMAISALLRGPLGFTTVIETGSLDELKLNAE